MRIFPQPLRLLLPVACLLTSTPGSGAAQFEALSLPGGVFFGNLTAISDDGTTIVGTTFPLPNRAAYWSESEGLVVIGDGYAHNCSADGGVIVGNAAGYGAFRHIRGGMTSSLVPPVSNLTFSGAYDVSPDGTVVVGNYGFTDGLDEVVCAYRWDSGAGFEILVSVTNGSWCNATGVDATGDIVCGFNEDRAFRWTASMGYEELPLLPGGMVPHYMSTDGGDIVGSYGEYGTGVFRWNSQNGMKILVADDAGNIPSYGPTPSLSPDGAVASAPGPLGAVRALVWDQHNAARSAKDVLRYEHGLPVDDWTQLTVGGLSGDQTVVFGLGVDPLGVARTWVAHLDRPFQATRLGIALASASGIEISWLGSSNETYTIQWRAADGPSDSWGTHETVTGQEGLMSTHDGPTLSNGGKDFRLVKHPAP